MFELAQFVVSAERDWRQGNDVKTSDESGLEARVWLWRHKALLLIAGVLALFIIGRIGT